jgi:aspartyl-tRNA synthetase
MSENIYPIDAALDLAYAANQEPNVAARALLIEMAGVVINRDPDSPFGTYVSEEGHDVAEQAEAANIARAQSLLDHIRSDRTIGNLIKRHQIKQAARSVFDELGFVEVDTPVLGSAMTEYTKDNFRVTGNAGEFFLPQSPQVYKQALVINTIPRYFQFAKCFRDEDYGSGERNDQLHEFTQIDFELRCEDETELRGYAEEVVSQLFTKFGQECTRPFPVIDYQECLAKYGTDKPDLRRDGIENAFLWVVNFPQFVKNEQGEAVTTHHPFQMPVIQDVSDVKNNTYEIGSSTFDLVLNGVEIGGGDMRINDYEIQKEVLEVLGLKPAQFSLLLESLKDGKAPKHGGMAIGLDRITMAVTGAGHINEVTAFNL